MNHARRLWTVCVVASCPLMWSAASASSASDVEGAAVPAGAATATGKAPASDFVIPVEYFKLDNGLRVVLSRDPTAATATVVLDYHVGGRVEPRGLTGFAHLFEHMMFQGSVNLGKMEFMDLVRFNGGAVNGATLWDTTTYYEIIPANLLQTVLWGEADRMKGLAITPEMLANQKAVVTNELKLRFVSQPYGGPPEVTLPGYAFSNWYNSHKVVGELADVNAATLPDVKNFFDRYYVPNNAVLVVTGNFEPAQAKAWIQKYFAPIRRAATPARPSLEEPTQQHEKRFSRKDPLATRSALYLGYRMPERNTPEFWAMGVIDHILVQGSDSLLHRELVQHRGLTDAVHGNHGIDNLFVSENPQLYIISLFHDPAKPADSIVAAADTVIDALASTPLDRATLDRALIKTRSDLLTAFEEMYGFEHGFGLANLLAKLTLFDDDPARINRLNAEFKKVTPELILETARKYLRPANRTVLAIEPDKVQP